MKKQEIQINRENIILRVILFLFFLTVGVTFIALYFTGVLQFQKGYSKIEIIPENQNIKADKIVYYAYFDGNSLSVRQNVKNLQGFYSRRINIQHRLVYQVYGEPVVVDNVKYDGTVKIVRMWTYYDKMR